MFYYLTRNFTSGYRPTSNYWYQQIKPMFAKFLLYGWIVSIGLFHLVIAVYDFNQEIKRIDTGSVRFEKNELQSNLNASVTKNFRFASYYQDHMVLQRSPQSAVLWGYGNVDSTVTIEVDGSVYKTSVKKESVGTGIWKVVLKPHEEGGPYKITATQTTEEKVTDKIFLNDVLFGEVWACSGQSNMQMALVVIFNSSFEINDTINYPDVRVFYVQLSTSETELYDLKGITTSWSVPSPDIMKSYSAVCWLYGKYLYQRLKIPIGLVHSAWGGTPVETWSSPNALHYCGLDKSKEPPLPSPNPQNNSLLWNAMIHPLLNMTIKGVIWYQGEQNTIYHKSEYNCSFPAMIRDWRSAWYEGTLGNTEKEFPFGFVQLGVLNEPESQDDGAYCEIRWHQTADVGFAPSSKMNNTFMAVALDLFDKGIPLASPHYRDKQDVSMRLALGAMHRVYGDESLISDGPYPAAIIHSSVTEVTIQYPASQFLELKESQTFQVCCVSHHCDKYDRFVSKTWSLSKVKTWTEHAIVLDTSVCPLGVSAVRYAWAVTPCEFKQCQVYNVKGLPAAPFWYKL